MLPCSSIGWEGGRDGVRDGARSWVGSFCWVDCGFREKRERRAISGCVIESVSGHVCWYCLGRRKDDGRPGPDLDLFTHHRNSVRLRAQVKERRVTNRSETHKPTAGNGNTRGACKRWLVYIPQSSSHLSRSSVAAFRVHSLHLSLSSAILPSRSFASCLPLNDSPVRRFLRHSEQANVPAHPPPTASIFLQPKCAFWEEQMRRRGGLRRSERHWYCCSTYGTAHSDVSVQQL